MNIINKLFILFNLKENVVLNMSDADIELKLKDETSTQDLKCRFYENQYPDPEEVVMANVTEIGELGAYVTLLEYNDIEVRNLHCYYMIYYIFISSGNDIVI